MKRSARLTATVMCAVMSVTAAFGLVGCRKKVYGEDEFNELALAFALSLMGNDAFAWNAFSATPYETYGYVGPKTHSWYTYSATDSDQIEMNNYLFKLYANELSHCSPSAMSDAAAATYRSMDNILSTYQDYYKSEYVNTFELLSGSYISSEGGYVADFAQSFENFEFRTEKDVKILLDVTQSTGDAFKSYLDFAKDRDDGGYPLYDSTLNAMREYLDDVYQKGEQFYLYELADKKIENAEFLNASSKAEYKAEYKSALNESFMTGVKKLYDGLDQYTGRVETTVKSYLAAAGDAGKAYYEWLFRQKTGIKDLDLTVLYNDLVKAYNNYLKKGKDIIDFIDSLQDTDKATYDEFYEYYHETKLLLGLSDPQEILEYLKIAAKDIVPDLKSQPEIGFKYMDDTVAEITNTSAYYMRTPLDLTDGKETITLNGYQIEQSAADLLVKIAHEGYPGHLYAYALAKESDTSLLSNCASTLAFSEGWANYVELVLLDNIAKTANTATAKYCEYQKYNTLYGYLGMVLYDMQINYFGYTAAELESAEMIELLMEIPTAYVPYGYGMYTVYSLHEKAKTALGEKYNEVEFNAALLGEGFGPTLTRAQEIAEEFIRSKR